jgi:16S rRNA (guanine(966)-N(2))-methyltransferase RsmD
LATFSGEAIRPTPDRVREALFSILLSRCGTLAGARVLDLFAGSGALGIEALSRGAARAWFIDSAPQAVKTIGSNLERCKLTAQASVISRDVWLMLPAMTGSGPFQLIFADPPYGRGAGPRLLAEIARLRLLAPGGLLVLETAGSDPVPEEIPGLLRLDQRRYGTTMIHLFAESASEVKR